MDPATGVGVLGMNTRVSGLGLNRHWLEHIPSTKDSGTALVEPGLSVGDSSMAFMDPKLECLDLGLSLDDLGVGAGVSSSTSMDRGVGTGNLDTGTGIIGLASMDLVPSTGDPRTSFEISMLKHRISDLSIDIYSYIEK